MMSFRGVHQHLFKNLQDIEIDHDAALALLLHQGDFCPENETAIRLIDDKQFHFVVCPYGRVHTNVTNLKSCLRQFLNVRGESLVNLDIRNSQPLIFAAVLVDDLKVANGVDQPMPPDATKYVELVQAGQFYDYLMDEFGIPSADGRRSTFKQEFFASTFYCRNDPVTRKAEKFGRLFPNVYGLIRRRKEDDFTSLCKDLQRTESAIIIGDVATRCMIELAHAFVATIHDSILTTAKYADIIRGFMLEGFGWVGLTPTINVEPA